MWHEPDRVSLGSVAGLAKKWWGSGKVGKDIKVGKDAGGTGGEEISERRGEKRREIRRGKHWSVELDGPHRFQNTDETPMCCALYAGDAVTPTPS